MVGYRSHQAFTFHPHVWHESVAVEGPQLLLFGYTARGLHKLPQSDRKLLWEAGFTYIPATKNEYWGYQTSSSTLFRYHPTPRRQMFAPTDHDLLPFSRDVIGDLRMCLQRFPGHPPVRTFHRWWDGRGKATASAWTGCSVFKLRAHEAHLAAGGGCAPFGKLF